MQKKVAIIGLGYIGLPTAIIAVQSGLDVVGIDIDQNRVQKINEGAAVIQEPEIAAKLAEALATGRFKATTVYEHADFFIIAVPTPFTDDKKADLSYVFSAAAAIATVLKPGDCVILESTVPVGTTRILTDFFAHKTGMQAGAEFFVAHCPERVLPGNIFHELRVNDRIIGGIDRSSTRHVANFYKYFVSGDLYLTTAEAAEMTKLVENSYRDVNIAISHQVASMAYSIGLDPYEIIELANKHPRVKLLNPTCGVGGHCLAVDPWFLIETFPSQTKLFYAARKVNDGKPAEIVDLILKKVEKVAYKLNKKACKVLLLGATYKADIDDLRESPALEIAHTLGKEPNIQLMICEPNVPKERFDTHIKKHLVSLEEGMKESDLVVFLVPHAPFKLIDKKIFVHKHVLDFCGILHIPRKESFDQEQFFWATDSAQYDPKSEMITHGVAKKANAQFEERG